MNRMKGTERKEAVRNKRNTGGSFTFSVRLVFMHLLPVFLLFQTLMLSGCMNGPAALVKEANRYAAGKKEAAYYLQPAEYRMADLLNRYTVFQPGFFWEEREEILSEEPDGFENETTVSSDSCISSSRELGAVLKEAMEKAALGVRLSFDRAKYLPEGDELRQWLVSYRDSHVLETLCLNRVEAIRLENGNERAVYLTLYYDKGREDVLALRKAVEEEIDAFVRKQDSSASAGEAAEAVWNYLTTEVSYPGEDWDEDKAPSCLRADGALLDRCAAGPGFAGAASLLLTALGVENERFPEETEDGRWRIYNRICLDGVWYGMDCCFGAVTGGNRDFFLWEMKNPDSEE